MKQLIDITDEDVIAVIDRIHVSTKNKVISRNGLFGMDFHKSFNKYGDCSIDIQLESPDSITDGEYTTVSKCTMQFHHKSVWFTEYNTENEISGYNKNHFFGYLKLQELGYKLPVEPQFT